MRPLIIVMIFSFIGFTALADGPAADQNLSPVQKALLKQIEMISYNDTTPKSDSTTTIKVGNVKVTINEKKEKNEISVEIEEEEESNFDTDVVIKPKKKLSNFKTRWFLLDLGVSMYLDGFDYNIPAGYEGLDLNIGKSTNVNIHLFRNRLNLIKHHVNLMTGISFEFDNYRFSEDYTMLKNQPTLTLASIDGSVKKSKLAATYVYVPLMLNFESNPYSKKRSFRLNAGGFAGYLLEAHTKIKFNDGEKVKARDDFNLNKFKYGVTSQIGFGWFNLYANYALSDMFQKGEGPELNPFNFGIVLIGF